MNLSQQPKKVIYFCSRNFAEVVAIIHVAIVTEDNGTMNAYIESLIRPSVADEAGIGQNTFCTAGDFANIYM